ncbi:MAG: dethiobiotin synthase [Smithellaceae bacterium]|nr:dethiobiotin synthase [Smithellaceae bacterium]
MAVQTDEQVVILNRGIYIIGTDTGVGKTAVAAGMMRLLLKNQCRAAYFKPVASGMTVVDGARVSVDAAFVNVVSGFADNPEQVTPFVYADAVSPHLASRMAGRPIDKDVVSKSLDALKARYDWIVAESAGGLAVPLNDCGFMQYDLIRELKFPCLLVARTGLGTINHTLLTLSYAKSAGLIVKGIIMNVMGDSPIERDNVETIKKLSGVEAVFTLPVVAPLDTENLQAGNLGEIFEQAVRFDDIISLMGIV